MPTKKTAQPKVVSREKWLVARRQQLRDEKKLTKSHDRVSAARRRLPMVRLEKDYVFTGTEGKRSLLELFDGRRQLIVYHFMFDPDWDEGCPGCTGYVDALGDLSMLEERNTSLVLVSRAPLPKLKAYKKKQGWNVPWYSSFGTEFNYDFHVTLDESIKPVEYNYRKKKDMDPRTSSNMEGEAHGLSVFFRTGNEVFHTYSAFARGVEGVTNAYSLLDMTPYGRQEDWESSPRGWPQKPTYG